MRILQLALALALLAAPTAAEDAPHHHGSGSAMEAMQEQMSAVPMTGDPDVDFARMMIPHHQGAIDMARAELAHGKDPELRRLAEEIIAAQEREIAFLEQWLQKRGD
jgi:uncharacterized protein (DUF305 family)